MTARINGETRGNRRRCMHEPPDGHLWVPKRHMIPVGSLEWSERMRAWLPSRSAGRLCRRASSHCAPADAPFEAKVDPNESEYQRRPVGWRALGFAIIEQAVEDVHTLERNGVMNAGKVIGWPMVQYAGRRSEPRAIDGMRDTALPESLLAWWASDAPELLADWVGCQTDCNNMRRALGLPERMAT